MRPNTEQNLGGSTFGLVPDGLVFRQILSLKSELVIGQMGQNHSDFGQTVWFGP